MGRKTQDPVVRHWNGFQGCETSVGPYGRILGRDPNISEKVGEKFTKLTKRVFSMECFTADFLQFFTRRHQNLAFGRAAGYSQSNPRTQFPKILSLKSFATREATGTSLSDNNNLVPFYLW